jgi:hypothetical protein
VFTVAIAVLLLLQVPPPVVLDNVMVLPAHTAEEPVMPLTDGNVFIVSNAVDIQPAPVV